MIENTNKFMMYGILMIFVHGGRQLIIVTLIVTVCINIINNFPVYSLQSIIKYFNNFSQFFSLNYTYLEKDTGMLLSSVVLDVYMCGWEGGEKGSSGG